MARQIGERVGVILGGGGGKVVKFVGYGVYAGDEIPPQHIAGFNFGVPNPKLVMDDGQVCWGCETWWGSEVSVRKQIEEYETSGYDVQLVNMDEERARIRN
ncbi:hypothetical protein [Hyphomicrobium sp.]|uniref:hypothetical protein n=1 Tax=Hyphomicrobium sp. TaxID=82 RepID=UPI001DCDAA42|nr:hypothetical protein [Hyphomicrobium sp.]MBY0561486.1 hypothetical protein [Hyphomicrobium sp.]